MATEIEIVNMGLQACAARRITDLDEDSIEADEVNTCWNTIREATLRMHSWNSIATTAELTDTGETPVGGRWDKKYALPADCLHVYDVVTDDDDPWKVKGRYLFTDLAAPLSIEYAKRDVPMSEYDPLLVEVMSLRLAIQVCEPITQSTSKRKELEARLERLMQTAAVADGRESSNDEFQEDPWILARYRR